MTASDDAPRGATDGSSGKTEGRPLRVMLVANDGLSAGHVARMIAVAGGLERRAVQRELSLRLVLATTSQAHALLASSALAVVQLPAPAVARRAGFSDAERRRLVRGALEGVAESFAPDLFVADTFPSGPHGELAGLAVGRAKRALVRRSVPQERSDDETLTAGLRDYDLAIVADDPVAFETTLPLPIVRVAPITIGEARDAKSREASRAALGLREQGRVVLVASGGGGDENATLRATKLAEAIAILDPNTCVALALGPLASAQAPSTSRITLIHAAPLQPLLAAFDGAFAPAGYNTAHELAKAAVPTALFAQNRPFDDQAARAARFAKASLAIALSSLDDASITAALAWMASGPRTASIEAGGADRTADALLDLVTGKRITGTEEATR